MWRRSASCVTGLLFYSKVSFLLISVPFISKDHAKRRLLLLDIVFMHLSLEWRRSTCSSHFTQSGRGHFFPIIAGKSIRYIFNDLLYYLDSLTFNSSVFKVIYNCFLVAKTVLNLDHSHLKITDVFEGELVTFPAGFLWQQAYFISQEAVLQLFLWWQNWVFD